MKRVFTLLAGLVLCVSPLVLAQPEEAPLGIFTHAATLTDGFAFPEDQSYSNGAYTIIASGNDVWNNSDGAYYACKEISGSFVVTADFEWNRMVQPEQDFTAGNEWMKMGIMFRAEADNAASQHAYAILRRDYGTDLQWRDTAGGSSGDSGLIAKGATELNTIRLQRSGNTFVAYRKQADGTFKQIGSHTNDT
ncbi:MAG: hypothetical protein RBU29_16990, partial [bacterium]|nr:hypothetical protein [bacterium]